MSDKDEEWVACAGNNCKLLQIAFVASQTVFYKIRIIKFCWMDCSFSSSLEIPSVS